MTDVTHTLELADDVAEQLEDYRHSKCWDLKQDLDGSETVGVLLQEAESYRNRHHETLYALRNGEVETTDRDTVRVGRAVMSAESAVSLADRLLEAAADVEDWDGWTRGERIDEPEEA